MRLRLQITVIWPAFCACCLPASIQASEPQTKNGKIKEDAYYEFRGHISDRNTIEHTFTLGWDKGSQIIVVGRDTKIYRMGRAAKLDDAKSGDAARGFGQVKNGRLIALAVAFGAEGVELPLGVKTPDSIIFPPPLKR